MGFFSNFLCLFDSNAIMSDDSSCGDINPANGLPMVNGCTGVDVCGNPFGSDSCFDTVNTSMFDDSTFSSDSFGSIGGISFDD